MIFRSSVWLGFPGFIANISVVNRTDMWPSAFCVGSAVGTEIVSPSSCSRKERKFGCESEPGYDGFSLCYSPASVFVPPSESPAQGAGRCLVRGRMRGSAGQAGPKRFVVLTRCGSAGIAEGTPLPKSGIWRRKGIGIPEWAVKPPVWFVPAQHR